MIAIHWLLTVNYTIPDGRPVGRLRSENNATQHSWAGAEFGNICLRVFL